MMAGTAVLSKILDIREREKKDAQVDYHKAVNVFEEIATKLLALLKKKEAAEASYDNVLLSSMHLDLIQDQLTYIDTLTKKIDELQVQVQQARSIMEFKQQKLSEAHVETKKFEKIIEIRNNEETLLMKKVEESFMNEMSIQQYLSHKK